MSHFYTNNYVSYCDNKCNTYKLILTNKQNYTFMILTISTILLTIPTIILVDIIHQLITNK